MQLVVAAEAGWLQARAFARRGQRTQRQAKSKSFACKWDWAFWRCLKLLLELLIEKLKKPSAFSAGLPAKEIAEEGRENVRHSNTKVRQCCSGCLRPGDT